MPVVPVPWRVAVCCSVGLRCLVGSLLAIGWAAAPPGLAIAGDSRSLLVTATVRERTVVRVLSAPATLRVTPEDLARGEVEVQAPLRLAVDTNAPDGALLALSLSYGPAQAVRLSDGGASLPGVGATVQAGLQPVEVPVPRQGTGRQRTTLTWHARFALRPDAQPGVYDWPLQVEARARAP